jgi:hypothetical protein
MTDQDGVLLDRGYKTTIAIGNFLQRLPKGIVLVPNSDTPVERISNNFFWAAGIRPEIIIGERGAVVSFCGKLYTFDHISGLQSYLKRLKQAFAGQDCDVAVGDSATWVRDQKIFAPNRRMLIIDDLRRQSIGFYLRTTDSYGVALRDDSWFRAGCRIVKRILLPAGIVANDFNEAYGIVIMDAAGVSKTSGYEFLLQKYPTAEFFMIGDGDADIIGSNRITHCAVANASAKIKKVAKFVSQKTFTEGFLDCLSWIMGK